jgi:hypothetical protein
MARARFLYVRNVRSQDYFMVITRVLSPSATRKFDVDIFFTHHVNLIVMTIFVINSNFVAAPISTISPGITGEPDKATPLTVSYDIIDITGDEPILDFSPIDLTLSEECPQQSATSAPPLKAFSSGNAEITHIVPDTPSPNPQTSSIKAFYPIFSSMKVASVHRPSQSKHTKGEIFMHTPFPSNGSQHIKGPQALYSAPDLPFAHRNKPYINTADNDSLSSLRLSNDSTDSNSMAFSSSFRLSSESDVANVVSSIPSEHASAHPAISYLLGKIPAHISDIRTPPQKLWAEKWRPTRAEHVLGNEQHALYLRDWLCAHKLDSPQIEKPTNHVENKGAKRSRDQPTISKKRGRKKRRIDSDSEDWLVGTEEEEEVMAIEGSSDDDFGLCEKIASKEIQKEAVVPSDCETIAPSIDTVARTRHVFDQRLTNTILLVGPTGVGKTAAVYACAEELDWEVFEVYPGITKRSGSSLNSLVGDVGKNHLARNMRSRRHSGNIKTKGDLTAISPFFMKDKDASPAAMDGGIGVGISDGFFGNQDEVEQLDGGISQPRSRVRQSMILLEEVDIVFKDDVNFWPAVMNLAKDCRRPIVMTCNGACHALYIVSSDLTIIG